MYRKFHHCSLIRAHRNEISEIRADITDTDNGHPEHCSPKAQKESQDTTHLRRGIDN